MISHLRFGQPPKKLEAHLSEVARHMGALIDQKQLRFPGLPQALVRDVAVLTGAGHDLAKATSYFQAYIRALAAGGTYAGNPYDKQHALLSACYGYHRVARLPLPGGWREVVPAAVCAAIAGHHTRLWGFQDLANHLTDRYDLLHRQLDALNPDVFEYRIAGLDPVPFDHADLDQTLRQFTRFSRVYALPRSSNPLDLLIPHRILTLLLSSVLLEADRVALMLDRPLPAPPRLPPDLVQDHLAALPIRLRPIDRFRQEAFAAVATDARLSPPDTPIRSITLPTGAGKTLTALHYALTLRERAPAPRPKIVTAMPYLSIIDQTDEVYRAVFQDALAQVGNRAYMPRHSISPFTYDTGGAPLQDSGVEFALTTWQAEVIATTIDQILLAIFSPRRQHLIRFHALLNAVLILDEVQAIPPSLWVTVRRFLESMGTIGGTRVIATSATQPQLFPAARECVPAPETYFSRMNRIRISVAAGRETVPAFCSRILPAIRARSESVLVTVNTLDTSVQVFTSLQAGLGQNRVHYLSSLLAPLDRGAVIREVKEDLAAGGAPVLVSTQCIEAGVDIGLARVYRDFAPLDAIVQVGGRCNRTGDLGEPGSVEVVRLVDSADRPYAGMIYDPVALECTEEILAGIPWPLEERNLAPLVSRYFERVAARAGRSEKYAYAFANSSLRCDEEPVSLRTLLRGSDETVAVLVPGLDPGLVDDLRAVEGIADRWDRRTAFLRIYPRVAQASVSLRPAAAERVTAEVVAGIPVADPERYDRRGVGMRV